MAFYYVTCVRLSFETRAFCSEFRILLLGGGGGGGGTVPMLLKDIISTSYS